MFITLEGIEGSGKSTLAQALADKINARGKTTLLTHEPGATKLGQALRRMLLDHDTSTEQKNLAPLAELLLFEADRAQHLHEVIQPALARGEIVICDRFIHSTLAYQGFGRGISTEIINQLNQIATTKLSPDYTFILDLAVEEGLRRAKKRGEGLDRFESERQAFHEKVRQGFLAIAKNSSTASSTKFSILDANQSPLQICNQAFAVIETAL
ncbi:dTMP kinase [bacterium]|nr:dTMP kinase [bacterium]